MAPGVTDATPSVFVIDKSLMVTIVAGSVLMLFVGIESVAGVLVLMLTVLSRGPVALDCTGNYKNRNKDGQSLQKDEVRGWRDVPVYRDLVGSRGTNSHPIVEYQGTLCHRS